MKFAEFEGNAETLSWMDPETLTAELWFSIYVECQSGSSKGQGPTLPFSVLLVAYKIFQATLSGLHMNSLNSLADVTTRRMSATIWCLVLRQLFKEQGGNCWKISWILTQQKELIMFLFVIRGCADEQADLSQPETVADWNLCPIFTWTFLFLCFPPTF